jgi:tRNA nucleotidyltransferase/poly(A) polymerase
MPVLRSYKQIAETLANSTLIDTVFTLAEDRGMHAYLVGGTVRDLLLGREIHDLDFAVQGSGLALARRVADRLGGYFVPLDLERQTGRILLDQADLPATAAAWSPSLPPARHIDIAALREESLQADLEGRDFTFNAIAIARTGAGWQVVDPLNGHKDLGHALLRMASPDSFGKDPVRTLRAVRLKVQFGCTIDPITYASLGSAVRLLKRVSAERVRDEWFKILHLAHTATAVEEMAQLGLLLEVAPSVAQREDLDHALATVRATERLWTVLCAPAALPRTGADQTIAQTLSRFGAHLCRRYAAQICDERTYLALLKCAALLHVADDGDDADSTSASRWKLSKRETRVLHTAIEHHTDAQTLIETGLTRRAIYRFFAQTGEPGLDAAMLHLAHTLAAGELANDAEHVRHTTSGTAQLLSAWFEHQDTLIAPTPLLSGKDVMRVLGLPPGPHIGELLHRMAEEQAAGELVTRRQAIAAIQAWNVQGGAKRSGQEQARPSG